MPANDSALDVLLDHLKRSRGFDFTGYKRSSLERRIARRMEDVGVSDHNAYLDYLEVHQDEFAFLFNTILINVTAFFRDAQAWDYLAEEVVPRLLEAIGDEAPIRVWCAGCASGEETYTLAMVLAEALGERRYCDRVKIYATDIDEEALNEARLASYTAKQVEAVPAELRERYFDRVEQRYIFRKDLRRTVIFGRNDLVQDAPISRIDLLSCRNTLMYLNAETQSHILRRFHFALNDWGCLFLGKSEMLITHTDLFQPINLKRRAFMKVPRPTMRDRLLFATHAPGTEYGVAVDEAIRGSAFDVAPVAQIVVDAESTLIAVNRSARELFALTAGDIGRPLKDLEISYRPVDLRSSLENAWSSRHGVSLSTAQFKSSVGDPLELEVHITPLLDAEEVRGATITFEDVTAQRRLRDDLEASKHELEHAYEELQSTVEELETTNEELQSTNEELETTNEELQSTNEELETMNEELQSTNEELETMNDELRQRTLELNEVNAFLETILTSMGVAVAVVDAQQRVQVWNRHAQDLWGLRDEEVEGEHLLGLDIGLPVGELKSALQTVLSGREERVERLLDATNRRGRAIACRVTTLPLTVADGNVNGAILLMEQELDGREDGARR